MSYNGSGTFQINTSGQPVVTGTVISSTAFNALTADLANGLSTAITKDGQTATTARIPFAQGINSSLATDATNTATGSIITAGGVGIAKALFVGTTANIAGLTASKPVFTDASKNLVSTGTLGADQGGSGAVTLTGVLKGNGTSAFTAATAGSDYVAPGTATTFTALQTFNGTSSNASHKATNMLEVATVSATAATGTIQYDNTTQSVLYYTTNASGNFTLNFRGSSGTTLNTVMSTGESLSATFLVTNGSTAYYNSAVTVDGVSVTPKWQGGTAPTSGNASSIDSYTYVIIKTGSAAFTVLASQTKFA